MKVDYLTAAVLSPAAQELVQFDIASIRQIVAGSHRHPPDSWLADPAGYERNGRVLRDTTSSRLLAYSTEDRIVYATDGCNSCTLHLPADLKTMTEAELREFAGSHDVPMELLAGLHR